MKGITTILFFVFFVVLFNPSNAQVVQIQSDKKQLIKKERLPSDQTKKLITINPISVIPLKKDVNNINNLKNKKPRKINKYDKKINNSGMIKREENE